MKSISITEAARLKKVARQTIYNNADLFKWTDDNRIVVNKQFERWNPDPRGRNADK